MKIIIRDEQGIKRCFAQVRDVTYLAERCGSVKLRRLALGNSAYRNLSELDFFEVKNKGIAEIIEENPYIVDFSEMVKYDGLTLSRIILLSQTPLATGKKKMDEQHKVEDLQDIISFNNGMLTYQIPIFFDEKTLVDNGEVVFGSTTMPDYYMLRGYNKDTDLNEYLEQNVHALFESVRPDGEMDSYSVMNVGDSLIVHFKEKKKILSQIKKRLAI